MQPFGVAKWSASFNWLEVKAGILRLPQRQVTTPCDPVLIIKFSRITSRHARDNETNEAMATATVQVQNVLQTANSLNNALMSPDYSSSTGLSDQLYQALVTGLVGSDPLVYGAVVVLDPVHAGDPSSPSARRAPFVFRNSTTNKLQVVRISPKCAL